MGDPKKELQKIIAAHPESVQLLLKGLGINKPATPDVLINAFVIHGGKVAEGLAELEKSSNYDATTTTTGDKTLLDKITETLMSGAQLTNQINQIINPNAKPLPGTTTTAQNADELEAYKKAEAEKNAKTLLLVSISVIIVIIIAIIIVKRASK